MWSESSRVGHSDKWAPCGAREIYWDFIWVHLRGRKHHTVPFMIINEIINCLQLHLLDYIVTFTFLRPVPFTSKQSALSLSTRQLFTFFMFIKILPHNIFSLASSPHIYSSSRDEAHSGSFPLFYFLFKYSGRQGIKEGRHVEKSFKSQIKVMLNCE